jgi:NADPH:quinone reductase-like Zn-dependent oxidoreductase
MATAGVEPGESVLVAGATGGVGTTLVPLLAAAKARVIATATTADAEILRGLGAETTIGYDDYPSDVDVAVNLTLPGDRLAEVAAAVRPGGRLLTITLPPPEPVRDDIDIQFVLDMAGRHGGMAEVVAVRAMVGRRYSLDEGPQACADFLRRHTSGKLVVRM